MQTCRYLAQSINYFLKYVLGIVYNSTYYIVKERTCQDKFILSIVSNKPHEIPPHPPTPPKKEKLLKKTISKQIEPAGIHCYQWPNFIYITSITKKLQDGLGFKKS